MPRWKALPDELDPQIREFTSQLRRLVDRSGLSVAAVSDRTGYSKTSWERYLNGRLLAPKGAIVALAEVTGTNPVHLTTMWELAERAWSRSEMRHDMTMEAIRISQARAALSEFGPPPAGAKRAGSSGSARVGGGATVTPGVAGPAGVAPTVPVQPSGPDADVRDAVPRAPGSSADDAPSVNSWNIAGYRGPSPAVRRPGEGPAGPSAPATPATPAGASAGARAPQPPGAFGAPPSGPRTGGGQGRSGGGRRLPMVLAGVVGVVIVLVAAFLFTNRGDEKKNEGGTKPSPTASKDPVLPPGVDCLGETCTGKDAETMGCSGDLVTTAATATVGTTVVEVRYSETCQAAWGRITAGAAGDEVKVTAGKASETGTITEAGDTSAYTPMVAVKDAGEALACATLAAGTTGCTD
ncbi:DUF2690 domain-containing protein [Streptomyces sp. NPDC006458]|uniref:helix-turn-helix domain-containing protein n=1 Tax=Streptomyces sp. NPDC006458 TaxID=3154302 RepID=UPI0033A13C12